MEAPHFEIVYGQGAHTPASHRKCANGETSDGKRTDCSAPERERAECDRAKAEGAISAHWALPLHGVASRRLNRANSFRVVLHVAHGVLRFSSGFHEGFKRIEQ
jgi:hypothetical protein